MSRDLPATVNDSSVPPGTPSWITAPLIELTIKTWQRFSQKLLTPQDAVTMILNVSQLQRVIVGA
jgi:hypothetical protein